MATSSTPRRDHSRRGNVATDARYGAQCNAIIDHLSQRDAANSTICAELGQPFHLVDGVLWGDGTVPERIRKALPLLSQVNLHALPLQTRQDLGMAIGAMEKAASGDHSGIADQYLRLVSTARGNGEPRVFFTIWNRTGEPNVEPCLLVCNVNERNLKLLAVTRSRAFVEKIVQRMGASTYPEQILSSRMQGIEILLGAGVRPHVLFADFIKMGDNNGIDPSKAGGLLFDSFGDGFLFEQMRMVEKAFPNVAAWFQENSLLNTEAIRLLTTAHVQAHDLCGHAVPFDLRDPTRSQVDWFLRAPLEEYYADSQAMWIYSSPVTRKLLTGVLTEVEMDAVPLLIAMKRLAFYAMKDVEDLDARCSWMFFGYWRKAGLIRPIRGKLGTFYFDIPSVPEVVDQMMSDILRVEWAIAKGQEAYEREGRAFSYRFGYENPVTGKWKMPEELAITLTR